MGLGGSTETGRKSARQHCTTSNWSGFREIDPHQCRVLLSVSTYAYDMIATMIKKTSTQSEQDTAFQLRYGKIGIAAVAAAAP
jgi:hypothetical protein